MGWGRTGYGACAGASAATPLRAIPASWATPQNSYHHAGTLTLFRVEHLPKLCVEKQKMCPLQTYPRETIPDFLGSRGAWHDACNGGGGGGQEGEHLGHAQYKGFPEEGRPLRSMSFPFLQCGL